MRVHYLFTVVKQNISNRDIVFYIRISYLNLRDKPTLSNQVLLKYQIIGIICMKGLCVIEKIDEEN